MFRETNNGRVLREPTSSFLSFRHRVHIWKKLRKKCGFEFAILSFWKLSQFEIKNECVMLNVCVDLTNLTNLLGRNF